METVTLTLCGSTRNLYGKKIECDRRYHHPYRDGHHAIATGKDIIWDGAPSVDIPPRVVQVPVNG
jgi:hypothetical protein